MQEKEVFSSTDESVVSRLCDIFNTQGISYIRKDGGAGSYLSIVDGQDTLSQKKIFVSEEDYEKARELIDFLGVEESKEEKIKALKVIPIEDEFGFRKYHTIKVVLGVFLGTTLLLLLLFLIVQVLVFVF